MGAELKSSDLKELWRWLLRRRRRFRIVGRSMLPHLKPGEEVLVDPTAYRHAPPRPGDIVVVRHPYQTNTRLIKRVREVSANGDCLLLGDNPTESTDSRAWGQVATTQILGRVTSRLP